MFTNIKNHPFAVSAFFEKSLVLTFAVPKHELLKFIPECLELDTYDNKLGFIAVALVKTKYLRPSGLPKFMGNNFFLIGYRVFVKYTDNNGKRLRGLYILKSETDKKRMSFAGNLFTHYNYKTTDINLRKTRNNFEISSLRSNFHIHISETNDEVNLPINSPFKNWKEARRFAGPLPFTFTYNKKNQEVLIIEGVRKNWKPKPIHVLSYDINFLNQLKINQSFLANAFSVENIPYQWKKGKIELWKPNEENFKVF